uniref:Insulin-like domain-containing protein n=2 Tax=Tetranychus urticae TaxID=32264 RepID=T1K2S7_TETUR
MVFVLIFPLIYSFPKRSDSDLLQSRDLRSQKIRTCGRNLMDLIQLVCSGSLPGKRSYHDENWAIRDNTAWSQDTQFNKLNFEENDSDTSNFMEPKAAFSLFGLNKRSQNEDSQVFFRSLRGATDECCYKSCTMNQLRAYCRPSGR